MLGTKTVNKYKIITFIKNENVPNVMMFRGRVMILKTGLIIKNIKYSIIPPKMYVGIPPLIFTPGNTKVIAKSPNE